MESYHSNAVKAIAAISRIRGLPLYVVGGTVRDILLERASRDIDLLVFGDAWNLASELALAVEGSWFVLDEFHRQVRVVSRRYKGIQLDIAESKHQNLVDNLKNRDFTINAMALDIEDYQHFLIHRDLSWVQEHIIDPSGGRSDIHSKLVRLNHQQAFIDDPLRLLRALRLAGKLGFSIEPGTRQVISGSANLLQLTAPERIRDEVFLILSMPDSADLILEMNYLGILDTVFPELAATVGVEQNQHHSLDVWGHTLATLSCLETRPWTSLALDPIVQEHLEDHLSYPLVEDRNRWLLLKMAALLHDVGKPRVREVGLEGRISFYRHETVGAGMVSDIADRLRLSRKEERFLNAVVAHHLRPLHLFLAKNHTSKAEYRLFKQLREDAVSILLLSLADRRAGKPEHKQSEITEYFIFCEQLIKSYYQEFRPATNGRLIGGEELVEEFKLSPGPLIGQILDWVEEAQMDKRITTQEDAYKLVRNILNTAKLDQH